MGDPDQKAPQPPLSPATKARLKAERKAAFEAQRVQQKPTENASEKSALSKAEMRKLRREQQESQREAKKGGASSTAPKIVTNKPHGEKAQSPKEEDVIKKELVNNEDKIGDSVEKVQVTLKELETNASAVENPIPEEGEDGDDESEDEGDYDSDASQEYEIRYGFATKNEPVNGGEFGFLEETEKVRVDYGSKPGPLHVNSRITLAFEAMLSYESRKAVIAKTRHDIMPQIPRKAYKLGMMFLENTNKDSTSDSISVIDLIKSAIDKFPEDESNLNLDLYISKITEYLNTCVPFTPNIKNLVHNIRLKLSSEYLESYSSELEVRTALSAEIETMLLEMDKSQKQTSENLKDLFSDKYEKIIVFAMNPVIRDGLFEAKAAGKMFEIFYVVTDMPLSKHQLVYIEQLNEKGIYVYQRLLINVLKVFKCHKISRVIMSAYQILSDCSVVTRIGAGSISLLANYADVPVIVCSETNKYSKNSTLNSYPLNELGKSRIYVEPDWADDYDDSDVEDDRIRTFIPQPLFETVKAKHIHSFVTEKGVYKTDLIPSIVGLKVRKSKIPLMF